MSLRTYNRKRDFRQTREPKGKAGRGRGHRFVVQKHAASRLHYDFRLEVDGTLKSWAVPKGIPFKHGEKRLAVQVEDHPVSYIDFEGTIPKGQYGGGTVMVWDTGRYEVDREASKNDLRGGKLHFKLNGRKLKGEWYLVRLRGDENQWLLIRGGESMKPVSKREDDTSALSGRNMKELAESDAVWEPKAGGRKRKSEAKAAAAPASVTTKHGLKRAATKKPKGKPPVFVEPMKAKLVAEPPAGEWLYEIKFDGVRALALRHGDGVRLLSRNQKNLAQKYPDVADAIADLDVGDVVLDGEVVALDEKGRSSFQALQAREIGEEEAPLCFYAFDLLRLDGGDWTGRPLEERKARLGRLLGRGDKVLRFSDSLGGDAARLLKEARRLGLEGLIGKRAGSRYEIGRRSGSWIKLKLLHEQEFVIGGYTPPGGSRKHFGALLVGVYDAKGHLGFCGKVGTGFDAARLKSLQATMDSHARKTCPFDDLPRRKTTRGGLTAGEFKRCHWITPALVAQIRFSEWTRDGSLRQPVFLGLREDKKPREVRREREA